jgi:phosphonate transport system substrate-binding protein
MIDRRTLLAGLAAGAATATATRAHAQAWKAKYPELVFAAVPAENASTVMDNYAPFMAYLSREIGTKVTLRIASDYAAVIEGQRAGNVHIGYYGAASFARARLIGVKTDAFCVDINADGTIGYYSVFYVRANSPYQTLADVKGKALALVDPNSTSGYNVPFYELNKRGIAAADKYFSRLVIAGSHENALMALAQSTVDVAANEWTSADDNHASKLATRGMLKDAFGKALTYADFRIILKSDPIVNGPYTYLSDLPQDLKTAIRQAFLDAPMKDRVAFDRLTAGKKRGWQPIANADYDDTIKLIQFVDALKKQNNS